MFHTIASRSLPPSTPSVARTPRPLVSSAPHQSGPASLCSPLLIYNLIMSRTPPIDIVAPDPLISSDTATFSPPRHTSYRRPPPCQSGSSLHHQSFPSPQSNMSTSEAVTLVGTSERTETDESMPLLDHRKRKPFYRARPLWCVLAVF